MSGNGSLADIGVGVDERATGKRISGVAAPALRVVPPASSAAPAAEIDGELVPPEAGSKALVRSFISNRSFETLMVLARVLVAAPEFPEALRNDTLEALEGIKSKEQKEIISDALKAYKPYTKRLPKGGAEEMTAWCQDRSQHHHLYTVLGTTAALASILAIDQTLVQKVVASGLREESVRVADELNKLLLAHYRALLEGEAAASAAALVSEGRGKNPMAVTLFIKGWLAPLLEIERPARRGLSLLFIPLGRIDAPEGLAGISDVPWTEKRTADIGVLFSVAAQTKVKIEQEKQQKERAQQKEQDRIKREAEAKEAAAKEAAQRAVRLEREREEDKLGLKGITLVKLIDQRFVQRVLSAQGTANEKVAFLTAAVGLATTVDESAIIELAEQIPALQGVSLTGGTSATLNSEMIELIKKYGIGKWSPSETEVYVYGPGMLAVALHKCSGLRNPAYAEVIKARFLDKCEEWKGQWKKEFCDDVVKLFSRLISDALKKGVDLSDR